jgi:rubrerythrin
MDVPVIMRQSHGPESGISASDAVKMNSRYEIIKKRKWRTSMDFGMALKRLEELEDEIKKLYSWFARLCAPEPSVAAIFDSLSAEEHMHGDILRYQFRTYQKNRGRFKDVDVDMDAITALAGKVREIRSSGKITTSEEALEAAYEIENSASEHYYVLAGSQSNPEIKNVLKAMASGSNEHHGRLAKFFISTGLDVSTDKDFEPEDPEQ